MSESGTPLKRLAELNNQPGFATVSNFLPSSTPVNPPPPPPPVPPRPDAQQLGALNPVYYDNYAAQLAPYPASSLNYYGGMTSNYYNNYGNRLGYNYNYGTNYGTNTYYNSNMNDSEITRLAEEQSRMAFRYMDSVTQTFSSVAIMLDSTMNAFHTSFRAVLGLADQFSRLKAHMHHLFTSLAMFRLLRWLWYRVLRYFRIRTDADEAWADALRSAINDLPSGETSDKKPNWMLMIFTAVALGAPWLVWKLANSMVSAAKEKSLWASGMSQHYLAVALYSFTSGSPMELSFMAGEQIRIAPKDIQPQVRGWLLASKTDGKQIGLVPANYVKIFSSKGVEAKPAVEKLKHEEMLEGIFECL